MHDSIFCASNPRVLERPLSFTRRSCYEFFTYKFVHAWAFQVPNQDRKAGLGHTLGQASIGNLSMWQKPCEGEDAVPFSELESLPCHSYHGGPKVRCRFLVSSRLGARCLRQRLNLARKSRANTRVAHYLTIVVSLSPMDAWCLGVERRTR